MQYIFIHINTLTNRLEYVRYASYVVIVQYPFDIR